MRADRLPDLQNRFQRYLLDTHGEFDAEVVGADAGETRERLQIYVDAYRLRLLEALETDYVALRAHLGPERFEALGRAYLEAFPSRHYSLRYFGRELSGFLAGSAPWRDEPFLAELARFEWALTDAFDAADSPVATPEDMAGIAPEAWPGLVFVPHASLIRLDLAWNAPLAWKAADQGERLPAPERAPHPVGWVVWRQGVQNYFRSLTVDEAWALDALLQGDPFAAICEGLCEWIDAQNVAVHAAGLLKQWLADGMIREITRPAP